MECGCLRGVILENWVVSVALLVRSGPVAFFGVGGMGCGYLEGAW